MIQKSKKIDKEEMKKSPNPKLIMRWNYICSLWEDYPINTKWLPVKVISQFFFGQNMHHI